MMEQSFRQAMTLSSGNPQIFVGSVLTISLGALSVVIIGHTVYKALSRKSRLRSAAQSAAT
jgi:TctA family transporter